MQTVLNVGSQGALIASLLQGVDQIDTRHKQAFANRSSSRAVSNLWVLIEELQILTEIKDDELFFVLIWAK